MTEAWVASVWYEDCDPFVTVVAKTEKLLADKVQEIVEEEGEENSDVLCWSGPVLEESIEEILGSSWSEEKKDEYEEQGYIYLGAMD
jgi:hypothetical protein